MQKALILILFIACIIVTFVSMSPYNTGFLILTIGLGLGACSIFMAFLINPWYFGTFKERFRKSLKLGFLFTTASYLSGYLFILIESLIRS